MIRQLWWLIQYLIIRSTGKPDKVEETEKYRKEIYYFGFPFNGWIDVYKYKNEV